ncbi:MAG TPA: hypothetical protein DCS97_06705 [Planctomycetes bacterium]|nr:hypothetical protein [Planctomycetota bacterium]
MVRAADGAIAGAVLAHRGGRSAVAARTVVDAGRLAPFARQAGQFFEAWNGGVIEVETRLLGVSAAEVGGEDLGEILLPAAQTPTHYPQAPIIPPSAMPWCRRSLRLELPDLGLDTLLGLETRLQLAAFHPAARGMSDWGFYVPPVGLRGLARCDTWHGAGGLDLRCLASTDPRLWLLGGAASVGRTVAARMLDPAALITLGTRLGHHLASHLPDATSAAQAVLPGAAIGATLRGARDGFSPVGATRPSITCDDGQAPELAAVDVLIAGGGTGGAPAGIAAAREGARTLVLERLHRLGGVGTLGRIGHYWFGNRTGFTAELDQRVFAGYGEPRFPAQQGAWWALEHKQDAWLRLLHEAGGRCWYGAQVCAAAVRGGRHVGALVATLHGAGLVRSAAAVDATGSADLAAAAGAPCRVTAAEHIAVQGTGLPPVDPRADYQNSDHDFCDDNDARDATRIMVRSRAKFADAWDAAPHIDTRERRQIRGQYELTPLDICCDRTFPDAVVRAMSNFDSHGFTVHPVFLVHPMDKKPLSAWIPYRALLPQGIDGILVTGLGMSAHRDALPVVRMQPDVQNAGFSAGVAAAMAARLGVGTAQIEVTELQRRLAALGHLAPEALAMADSFPLASAAVSELIGQRLGELVGCAAAFSAGAAAWPALRQALADPTRSERAALILGLQGDASAAATLRGLLANRTWDAGWRFTGMGQFGRSMSAVDVRLVALAHCGEAADLDILAAFAAGLGDDAPLSHVRAIAWACTVIARRIPDSPGLARTILSRLLLRPGMTGHAQTDLAATIASADGNAINTQERELALRELHLAAACWRCGGGSAGPLLEAYRNGLLGHYARHAAAVLAESPYA